MISIDNLKAWVNLSDSEHDEQLVALETRAVAYLESRSVRKLDDPKKLTEIRSGLGGNAVIVANPIAKLTKVEVRESATPDSWTNVAVASFFVDGRRLIWMDDQWPEGQSNVRITYTPLVTVEELAISEQAVLELVEKWWRDRVTATAGIPPGSSDEQLEIPRTVETIIRQLMSPAPGI